MASYLEANSLLEAGNPARATQQYYSFLNKWPVGEMTISALYQNGLANLLLEAYANASLSFEKSLQSQDRTPANLPAKYFLGLTRMKSASGLAIRYCNWRAESSG